MFEKLFGSEGEEEAEKKEIPEDELCDECGEERAVWKVVGGSIQLCNLCQIDREDHLMRIRSSLEEE
ncbi:hypothetical protein AKJ41_03830 [candidate division MSBL1 archaeon SCGC-AAA259O05]|uniref:Uncharacterized protein n=1 Tax=candidate division MSBL1 archaeon SCGC-AAA259O05 TaxID=1698271 RepID=A0A133V2L5_9EURY|nr:hypothetical protein AKJ41_03830 [candidate division MSBL1 archaeon SCGC-AAA259O05]